MAAAMVPLRSTVCGLWRSPAGAEGMCERDRAAEGQGGKAKHGGEKPSCTHAECQVVPATSWESPGVTWSPRLLCRYRTCWLSARLVCAGTKAPGPPSGLPNKISGVHL